MKILKKTAFLFILLAGLSIGASAQRDGDKKPTPPKGPDRPVVVPKEKPKDPPKEKPKKPGYSFYTGNIAIRNDLV